MAIPNTPSNIKPPPVEEPPIEVTSPINVIRPPPPSFPREPTPQWIAVELSPSTPVTGSHTGSPVGSPPSGESVTPKSTPPHAIPTPIPAPPSQLPVKVVSETVHTPPSEGSKTTMSQSKPTLPSVVGTPGSEHNAIPITPIEKTSTSPHVTPPSEAKKAPTNVITHLWIGWKIEPWEENFVKRFVETFEHGKHVHRPIELPPMGGVLAPIPGAPAPGAPVVTMQPQGASNQYQLTA